MSTHYYDSELIDLGDDYATAFVAEGDNGWVTGLWGGVETWADAETAFAFLNETRQKVYRVPAEHRAAVKNLARRLYEHIAAVKAVEA